MLLFSVYDHDVLLSNDFGGEAFFPLKDVPGIINPKGKGSVGNFHGLKQVELALMLQENEGNFNIRGNSNKTENPFSLKTTSTNDMISKTHILTIFQRNPKEP